MKEQIEVAGDVAEMLQLLMGGTEAEPVAPPVDVNDLKDEILMASFNTFLNILPCYLELDGEQQQDFLAALHAWRTSEERVVRQSAFGAMAEYIFGKPSKPTPPPVKEEKVIIRGEGKYETPCEDCETKPTHKVMFLCGKREETHYLCENCERSARRE